jgi:hypothetical protein
MTERFGHRRVVDLGRWNAHVKIDRTVRSSKNCEWDVIEAQGPGSGDSQVPSFVGWAKAPAWCSTRVKDSRAPCPPVASNQDVTISGGHGARKAFLRCQAVLPPLPTLQVTGRDHRRVAEGEWLTCRVGKGASMVLNTSERLSCAVPTSGVKSRRHDLWWARRTQGFPPLPSGATAFAHPTSDDVATRYFAASASSLK